MFDAPFIIFDAGAMKSAPKTCRFCGYAEDLDRVDQLGLYVCVDMDACREREVIQGLMPHDAVIPAGVRTNDPYGSGCAYAVPGSRLIVGHCGRPIFDPIHMRADEWPGDGVPRA